MSFCIAGRRSSWSPSASTAGFVVPGLRRVNMEQLAVEPAMQRRGVGSKLILVAGQLALEWGCAEIALDTSELAELIRLYEKRGYRLVPPSPKGFESPLHRSAGELDAFAIESFKSLPIRARASSFSRRTPASTAGAASSKTMTPSSKKRS
jgi:ribosomal protein S18 acetylase RimI-like enzyme